MQNPLDIKNVTIKQAVLATLAYFEIFEIWLTQEEIIDNLMFIKPDPEKIAIYLRESPLIKEIDGYFSTTNKKDFVLDFKNFLGKKERSKKYWKKVRRSLFILNMCPFIKLITVCNSLPINDTKESSDIDLFVVTQPNRMFTARLFLTGLTQIFGIRRHGDKIKKRFCLSFYVTEDNLNLKSINQKPYDIYMAYWIKTMEPLCGDYEVYRKLLDENKETLNSFFYSVPELKRHFRKRPSKIKKILEKLFDSDKIEIDQKKYQIKRTNEKFALLKDKSGTIISDNMLKFHDVDLRATVRDQWIHRLQSLLRVF